MSHQLQLANPKYRYWVAGGLAFKYLRDGLQPHVDHIVKAEHANILQIIGLAIGQVCNNGCTINNLQPDHTIARQVCPLRQKQCNCLRPGRKRPCPNNICDKIHDEIVRNHVSNSPFWKNCDVGKLCCDYFEAAKCYINVSGYESKKSPADLDITGVLHILINNKRCNLALGAIAVKIEQTRDRRNTLFHAAKMELEATDFNTWITDMIDILSDVKIAAFPDAVDAVQKLKELLANKFVITMTNEADVCKEAMQSIEKKIDDLKTSQEAETMERKDAVGDLQEENTARKNELSILQQQVATHEERLNRHDTEIQALREEICGLKTIHQNRQEHLQMLEDIMKLRALFSDRYVKTSMSPLQSTGDVDISTVYAPPDISREVEKQSPDGKREKTTKQVTRYREIFSADGKVRRRIYLIGDVGSGKSAFCKSMIKNWCTSRESPKTEDERTMAMFDYLFYIPLRTVHGENDVQEMVVSYYKMISNDTIEFIFRSMPEKCLVLLDGLDEWMPKKPDIQRLHETVGLPVCDDMNHVTILTTSRPSAAGILNMTKSDNDLKLTLNGVCYLEEFVEKYIKEDKRNEMDVDEFLENMEIEEIGKTPLLLQHITWLRSEGIDVGNTMADLYSTLVNTALRWNIEMRQEEELPSGSFQQLSFPAQLVDKFPAFEDCQSMIACLCRMSFDIYITGSKLSFGKRQLRKYGVDKQFLNRILQTGLLTEELRHDPSAEKTQFSFTHLSFLEFFCALDISSNVTTGETTPSLPHDTGSSASREIFSLLQDKCRSVEEVLRLKNVLVLVCGLSPDKILAVCQLVYNIMQQDEHFLNLRKQACRCSFFQEEGQYLEVAKQYQQLVFRCIREYKLSTSISEIRVPLLDVVIEGWTENEAETVNMTERHIDPRTVRSLCIHEKPDITLPTFVNLETIIMIGCDMSHAQSSSLAEYITRTVTLKNIRLSCSEGTCCHVIDLSRHEQLQSMWIEWTKNFSLNNINTTNLEYCYVSWTSGISFSSTESTKLQYIHIDQSSVHVSHIRLIHQSVLLKHIELERMELAKPGLQLDLSRHDQLETFKFYHKECLHVDSVNSSKLVHCKTDNREVLSCVRNAAVLEKLEMYDMQYNMEVHEILLTLPQLHTLTLCLVYMSRDVLDVIVNDKDKFLTGLTELFVSASPSVYNRPSIRDVNRFLQTLPQLQKLTLRPVDMRDDVLEVSPGMKHLTHITLEYATISSSCWIRFVDSLLTLQQSVTVETEWLRDRYAVEVWYDREANAAADYIRKRPEKYRILKESSSFFNFVTVK